MIWGDVTYTVLRLPPDVADAFPFTKADLSEFKKFDIPLETPVVVVVVEVAVRDVWLHHHHGIPTNPATEVAVHRGDGWVREILLETVATLLSVVSSKYEMY